MSQSCVAAAATAASTNQGMWGNPCSNVVNFKIAVLGTLLLRLEGRKVLIFNYLDVVKSCLFEFAMRCLLSECVDGYTHHLLVEWVNPFKPWIVPCLNVSFLIYVSLWFLRFMAVFVGVVERRNCSFVEWLNAWSSVFAQSPPPLRAYHRLPRGVPRAFHRLFEGA